MSHGVALPLAGRRVAVTRAADQANDLLALLRSRGAEPLACPTIEVVGPADGYAALDGAVRSLDRYRWVAFTSQNAVNAFADRIGALDIQLPHTVQLAAVGDATARAVAARLRDVDFIPSSARAESLAIELSDVVNRRVLFPRGDLASGTLAQVLRARGAVVEDVIAYRTVQGSGARELAALVRTGDVDAILFMSGSSIRRLLDALHAEGVTATLRTLGPAVICVGPETERVAREVGLSVSAVAVEQSVAGVVDALERWFGRESDGKGS